MLKVSKKFLPFCMSLSLLFPHIANADGGLSLFISMVSMVTSFATLYVTLNTRKEVKQTKVIAACALIGVASHQKGFQETLQSLGEFDILSPGKSLKRTAKKLDDNMIPAHGYILGGMNLLCEEVKSPGWNANNVKFVNQLREGLGEKKL